MILQCVGIGGFEFRQLPPIEDTRRQLMLRGKVFQNVGSGGIGSGFAFLAACESQFVKEDLAQLFG